MDARSKSESESQAKVQIIVSNEIKFVTIGHFQKMLNQTDALVESIEKIQEEKSYLTRKDVCELLHISLPTIYAYAKRNILKPVKVGSRVLFDKEEVMQLLTYKKLRNED